MTDQSNETLTQGAAEDPNAAGAAGSTAEQEPITSGNAGLADAEQQAQTAPPPPVASPPLVGFTVEDAVLVREQVFTLMLVNGMILQVRLLCDDHEFATSVANGDTLLCASLASITKDDQTAPAQAWLPFYVNSDNIVGFSPIYHIPANSQAVPVGETVLDENLGHAHDVV